MAMHALVRDHIKERGAEHALPSRPESDGDGGGGGEAGAAVDGNTNGDINQVSHLTSKSMYEQGAVVPRYTTCPNEPDMR